MGDAILEKGVHNPPPECALVVKNTGSLYTVKTDDGRTADCKIKGNFRLKGIRSTNPIAVGDRVIVSGPFITAIEPRRNYIIRKSTNLSKQCHIIAANVDQAALVVTVSRPQTTTVFIDRFLASAEAYRIPVILVFNKSDILSDDERRYQEKLMTLYDSIGYECLAVSALKGELSALGDRLQGRTTVLNGHSGVGKSTLINSLIPGLNLRTAEISEAHNTGMHTTTFSEMIELPGGGYIIDTPGIKGFGTFDIEPAELTSYFRDIFLFAKDCRFSDCTHTGEPDCAVVRAVADRRIAYSRYLSYLNMLGDKDESKYREAF